MFGRAYNLLMQHELYRALPHRRGEGVPVTLFNTAEWQRCALQQLRRELRVVRNIDMVAQLAAPSSG
jgi:hypothetical protein